MLRAATLGVDGVKVLMPWDVPPEERASRAELIGHVVAGAEEYGLPVMVEPLCLATPPGVTAVAIAGDGCRMAAELGADIIKVAYPGDSELLASWCDESGVPIVILGGPSGGSSEELLTMVADAVSAGALGVTIGRRLWQRPLTEAKELLQALYDVVHSPRAS
jgi:class I fructose-bisphosphate aldolase